MPRPTTDRLSRFATILQAALLAFAPGALAQQVKKPATAPAPPTTKAVARPVDLNNASVAELEALPGVGRVLAARIVEARPLRSFDDLTRLGLNANAIRQLQPLVVFGSPTAARKPATTTAARPANPATSPIATPAAKTEAKKAATPIDLNSASVAELETLPGVGPALAKAIVDGRPYRTVADLDRVKGLGARRIAEIQPLVRIGTPGEAKAAAALASTAPASSKGEQPAAEAADPRPEPKVAKKTVQAQRVATPPAKKIDINSATAKELEAIPFIGEVRAQLIIDGRPYAKLDDIKKVRGIGDRIFEQIKDWITVD